jgi:hypothetical protein
MSTPVSANMPVVLKNKFLELFKADQTTVKIAAFDTGDLVSNQVDATLGTVTGGELPIQSSVSLVIDAGESVNRIRVLEGTWPNPSNEWQVFDFDPISFPDGGTLVVSSLKFKISDPS